jgi:DNA-binding LacI/PurR family transcriptional regulator
MKDGEEGRIYTIEDIARELGISKTTVSRAISGKGRVSRETREKVLMFIEACDYRPNAAAKALAQRKTYNIGLILPREYAATEFRFFRDCMSGICEEASKYNYDVVITMADGYDMTQIHRMITNRKIDGIIISRSTTESSMEQLLKQRNIPFIVIGPSEDREIPCVDNQNLEAAREMVGILLMKGMRRLALLGGKTAHLVTESRCQGFLKAHSDQEIIPDDTLIFLEMDNYVKVMKAVDQALVSGADGIVCMDDFIAGLVLGCLREKGVRIPSEMKVASMYDSTQLEYNVPPVTSLWFDTRELGRSACRILLAQLGETIEVDTVRPNYQIIFRESTK